MHRSGRLLRSDRTLERLAGNLPHFTSSFVGRGDEIGELTRLLAGARLLTLTGVGGSGKTRLAREVAAALEGHFPEGTWWVELAPLNDGGLVPRAAAQALGVREQTGFPLTSTLAGHLLGRRALLILDNCEHVIAAAAELADRLLRTCPEVRILATSREALTLPGEVTFPVLPLALPDLRRLPAPSVLAGFAAIRLFIERAGAVSPGFALTSENAGTVALLCHRLDGLPLAIELAASRLRAMPLDEVTRRLDDRLGLLAGAARGTLPRQQTLRATIVWSYDLLTEPERTLFRRLSVFAGGWTLDAAEAVCGGTHQRETTDLLEQLVAKSLVLFDPAAGRYRFLETVREYALERLVELGEADRIRHRHRDYFLALAQRAQPQLRGADQHVWLGRLGAEHENLRAALEWCALTGDEAALLRLAAALWRFWNVLGYWSEGQQWLDRAVEAGPEPDSAAYAAAAFGAGVLAWYRYNHARAAALLEASHAQAVRLGDRRLEADVLRQQALVAASLGAHARARTLAGESLRRFEELGDKWGMAAAARVLMFHNSGSIRYASDRLDLALARRLAERSLALARELNDRRGIGFSQFGLVAVAREEGDWNTMGERAREGLAVLQEIGDRYGIQAALADLATVSRQTGDLLRAQELADESLAVAQEIGDSMAIASVKHLQGLIALDMGDPAAAEALIREALLGAHTAKNISVFASALQGLAQVAAVRKRWKRAALLLAGAEAARRDAGIVTFQPERTELNRLLQVVQAALGPAVFGATQQKAAAMPRQEMVGSALTDAGPVRGHEAAHPKAPLTEREQEVAVLVARGHANREIASALFISERTVESHIQHILNKLGARSRAQIAAWVVARSLV